MTTSIIEDVYRHFDAERFPRTTEEAVTDVEKQSHVKFPKHYRDYLLKQNGCYFDPPGPVIAAQSDEFPPPGLLWMFGIGADHPYGELYNPERLNLWDGNFPPILYPIGATEAGFFIILITESADDFGCIYLRTFESPIFGTENKSHYLAEDMQQFFSLLRAPDYDTGEM